MVAALVVVRPSDGYAQADSRAEAQEHARKGAAAFQRGEFLEAVTEYELAYARLPLPELVYNLARAREGAGELARAREDYLRYLVEEPDGRAQAEAREHLAGVLVRLRADELPGRGRAERGALAKAGPAERGRARTHFKAATELFEAGKLEGAADEYQAAFEAVPEPEFLYNVGKVLDDARQGARAASYYLAYLAGDPQGRAAAQARDRAVDLELESKLGAKPRPVVTVTAQARSRPLALPPERVPVHQRWWFWTALGGAAVALSIGLGVGLSQAAQDPYRTANPSYTFTASPPP